LLNNFESINSIDIKIKLRLLVTKNTSWLVQRYQTIVQDGGEPPIQISDKTS